MAMSNGTRYIIQGPSIGFCGLLTIVFVTLKLTHVIDWSWWFVLLPLYGPTALVFAVFLILSITYCIVSAASGGGRHQ